MALFQSRRFWMVILDLVVGVAGYISANLVADPKMVELIKFLVVAFQPVLITIIAAFTVEDVAGLKYPPQS